MNGGDTLVEKLETLTEEQLKEKMNEVRRELDARKRARVEEYRQQQAERNRKLLSVLSPELIDILAPKHDCTSCKDSEGGYSNSYIDHGVPRCVRCALMVAHKEQYLETEYNFVMRAEEDAPPS